MQAFFDFCCFDHSFVDLRRRTRQDLETTGNAFWEVLRDGRGELARLAYVPSHTVRLMPFDPAPVEDRVQVSPVAFEAVLARGGCPLTEAQQQDDTALFRWTGNLSENGPTKHEETRTTEAASIHAGVQGGGGETGPREREEPGNHRQGDGPERELGSHLGEAGRWRERCLRLGEGRGTTLAPGGEPTTADRDILRRVTAFFVKEAT